MSLNTLSKDEFLNVFSFLEAKDLLNTRRTSKKINQGVLLERIWLRLIVLEFRIVPEGPPPAFLLYWKTKKEKCIYQSFLQLTDIPEVATEINSARSNNSNQRSFQRLPLSNTFAETEFVNTESLRDLTLARPKHLDESLKPEKNNHNIILNTISDVFKKIFKKPNTPNSKLNSPNSKYNSPKLEIIRDEKERPSETKGSSTFDIYQPGIESTLFDLYGENVLEEGEELDEGEFVIKRVPLKKRTSSKSDVFLLL
eukprot:gene6128-10137_t